MKRWAAAMYRFRWLVIGLWLAALVVLQVLAGAAGSKYTDDFSLPDSDSTRAFTILEQTFPNDANAGVRVVFAARSGTLVDGTNSPAVSEALDEVEALPHVVSVVRLDAKGAGALSPDQRIGFADVAFDEAEADVDLTAVKTAIETARSHDSSTMQVEVSGPLVDWALAGEEQSPAELIGIVAAFIILAITFGTLVATVVPLATALIALGSSLSIVALLSHTVAMPDFGAILASLIGLGVGIDYALFIVSRFRNELHRGRPVQESVVTAINTSGRAVTFAGIIVCIALLGMVVLGLDFLISAAIASSVAVALTMLASVTLLPALLGVVGRHIDKVRLRPKSKPRTGPTRWERWAGLIQRRPVAAVLVGLLVVGAIATPAIALRLGFSDAGTGSTEKTTRQAYDLLGEGFGRGSNGPFLVTAALDSKEAASSLPRLEDPLRATPGVETVSAAFVAPDGEAALITLVPTSGPQDEETGELLATLRDDVIPVATAGTGVQAYVGGNTAMSTDFSSVLAEKTPQFIAVVVLLSMLLLVAVFRSLLIPLKAAVMNLLSIAAAFGVVVAVFQWGWGADAIGLSGVGPIEPFVPVILFAILFGLSMDYEVFLVSRMHEEWVRTGDNTTAVSRGLSTTAGVITAAAVIMISVFGAFLLFPERVVMIFGLGLAAAIFIDAFIIRSLLVPGVMFLMGKWSWYLPAWLDRIVPKVSVEGDIEEESTDERGHDDKELAGVRG
jgi:putative drug exporter of the RND superfamily